MQLRMLFKKAIKILITDINLNMQESQTGDTTAHNQATSTNKEPEVVYVSGYTGKIGCLLL